MFEQRGLAAAQVSVTGSGFSTDQDRPEDGFHRGLRSSGEGLGLTFLVDVAAVFDQAEELLLSKQRDYGPDNIAKSPFGPVFGLLVRLYDKQARAVNLISKDQQANHESLEDTFLDMLNYSAIALLVLRGQWPGLKGAGLDSR